MDAQRSHGGASRRVRMLVGLAWLAAAPGVPAGEPPRAAAVESASPADAVTRLAGGIDKIRSTLENVARTLPAAKATGADVRPQLDPDRPLPDLYPGAVRIDYAILVLPDPRVPRHRRSYEQALRSVIAGMGDRDYVLDRYYFPWQDYTGDKSAQGDRWAGKDQTDDGRHGVLVFRHDDWRGADAPAPPGQQQLPAPSSLRVLYVVAETVTAGVQQDALRNAANRIVDEVEGNAIANGDDGTEDDAKAGDATAGDAKAGDAKAGDAKAGDAKAGDAKAGDAKAGDAARPETYRYLEPPRSLESIERARDGRLLVIGPNFSSSVGGLDSAALDLDASQRVPVPAAIRARLPVLRQEIARLDKSAAQTCERAAFQWYQRFADDVARMLDARRRSMIDAMLVRVPEAFAECGSEAVRDTGEVAESIRDYFASLKEDRYVGRRGLVAISPSATVASNARINDLPHPMFEFRSMAVDDQTKLMGLLDYFDRNSGTDAGKPVMLLYETSSFGRGAFDSLQRTRLWRDDARQNGDREVRPRRYVSAAFPPNIADLRKRLRDQNDAAKRKAGVIDLSTDTYLSIEESAENGNEYPDGGTSSLTPVAADQQLRQLLASLRAGPEPPGVVIVAATDVRDRMYLFDRVGRELPNATLVDLEADLLLTHPDYVYATRGALMVSSALLLSASDVGGPDPREAGPVRDDICDVHDNASTKYSFDSDRQALLYEIVRCLDDGLLRTPTPLLYRIGRDGPVLLGSSEAVDGWVQNTSSLSFRDAQIYGTVSLSLALGLFLCAAYRTAARHRWQAPANRIAAQWRRFQSQARRRYDALARRRAAGTASVRKDVALQLCACAATLRWLRRGRTFARSPSAPGAGAPWWFQSRASGVAVASWLVALVLAVVAFRPLLQQYVSLRSYTSVPGTGGWQLGLAHVWLWLLAATVLWLGREIFVRWRCGRDAWKVLGLWPAAVLLAALVFAALVWRFVPYREPLSHDTVLWWLHFELWVVAVLALALCAALSRRVRRWTFYAETLIRAGQGGKDLGDWAGVQGPKPRFVATPIEAGARAGMYKLWPKPLVPDMAAELAALETGFCDTLAARMALRRLFWPSLNAIALSALAVVLCYAGIILLAWLYPVPSRGVPLLIGMLVAGVGTVLLVSSAIAFERSSLLSRLFCGTDKGLQISSQLLTIVTGPVLLLLLSIVAADQPGVLEWSGGIVKIVTGGR